MKARGIVIYTGKERPPSRADADLDERFKDNPNLVSLKGGH